MSITSRTRFASPFSFNGSTTPEIYTLSLHDALPIYRRQAAHVRRLHHREVRRRVAADDGRSEEHTSELQSHSDLVCRLLLEKKKRSPPRRAVTFHTQ